MIKINCPNCKHYLFETEKTVIAQNVKCSYCKQRFNLKCVTSDSDESDIRYNFKRANNDSLISNNTES